LVDFSRFTSRLVLLTCNFCSPIVCRSRALTITGLSLRVAFSTSLISSMAASAAATQFENEPPPLAETPFGVDRGTGSGEPAWAGLTNRARHSASPHAMTGPALRMRRLPGVVGRVVGRTDGLFTIFAAGRPNLGGGRPFFHDFPENPSR